jgi:predicted permease
MHFFGLIETLLQDVRYGFRGFRNSLGFTIVALLSLALGIGATTAIFSIVYGVLINPYPYSKPETIWAPQIVDSKSGQVRGSHWVSEYLEIKSLPAFSDVMATSWENVLLTGEHAPESFGGVLMSGNAFQFLGVPPLIGRTIQRSDVSSSGDAQPVVVLSYLLWQRLFNGDANAMGKTLYLNDEPHVVIGVMPPRFGWYGKDSFWLPLPTTHPEQRMANVIMRLAPGVSKESAEQQLQALHIRLAAEKPMNFPKLGFTIGLVNYLDITVASGEMKTSLHLLFYAVGFLLLIACANVANLQLSRSTARAREIAVRFAIGADRLRVLRQLLTESVVLSLIGGVFGVLLALVITKTIVVLMPEFYVPNEARISVNAYALIFSAVVSVLTGVLFGLAPGIQASVPRLAEFLKDGRGSESGSRTGGRTRNMLVITEVALSVILLVGATLTIRGFVALHQVNLGFHPERVLMLGLPLPPKRYPTLEQRNAFAQNILDRVRSLPGVVSAAIGNGGMPFGGPQSTYAITGQPQAENKRVRVGMISADYLTTMGIPLLGGRNLTEAEVAHGNAVALINESARKLWPAGEDPIGKRIRLDVLIDTHSPVVLIPSGGTQDVEVVGVIGNTRNAGLEREPDAAVLVPFTLLSPPQRQLAIRTQANPMLLLNAAREQVRAIDKDQPLGRPTTIEELLGYQTVQPRFNVVLFTGFAMLGLALAAAGIYSVISYHATRRTHEIGVRMALGAERGHVVMLMLNMGAKLVAIGLVIGIACSVVLAKFFRSQVFHVPATDPISVLASVLVLSMAALGACYLPARRAARIDPIVALRHD